MSSNPGTHPSQNISGNSTQRSALRSAALAVCTMTLAPFTASADEFCVSCSEPFAIYRCAVSIDGQLTAPAGAQFLCIKQLATQGGHKSCSVRRNSEVDCIGKLIVVTPAPGTTLPADHPLTTTPPPVEAANGPVDPATGEPATGEPVEPYEPGANPETVDNAPEPDEAQQPVGEPKTVEELARRTASSSQKGIKNAGKAVVDTAKSTGTQIKNAGKYVGGVAKQTWNCITTLFSDCGS